MSQIFTTLPLEVRNEIYSHVFHYDSITPKNNNTGKLLHLNTRPELDDTFLLYKTSDPQKFLALLCVNHQISDEAAAFFYGKTNFHGEWHEVAAFIKGIGAHRRDMIRSVEISHPVWLAFAFDKDENFELLSGLPNLRRVRIAASVPDFTHLQNELIRGGILELAGKFDIGVYNTCNERKLSDATPPVSQFYTDRYVWSCARGTTQWTGGERIRTIIAQFHTKRQCWVLTGNS